MGESSWNPRTGRQTDRQAAGEQAQRERPVKKTVGEPVGGAQSDGQRS